MAYPEPVRTFPANIQIVPTVVRGDLRPNLRRTITVNLRHWGDDDELYDHNSDGVPDFPLRANMRYARERRRRTVPVTVVIQPVPPDYDSFEAVDDKSFPGKRIWAGIGGFLYIPSFPQLRRKETTWPDAT